jgi:hypothetical protein
MAFPRELVKQRRDVILGCVRVVACVLRCQNIKCPYMWAGAWTTCVQVPSSEAVPAEGGVEPSSEADLARGGVEPSSEADLARGALRPSRERRGLERGGLRSWERLTLE